ncbi:MAG: hypothetical protein ABI462_09415 [Ignavibacteria bacterium]
MKYIPRYILLLLLFPLSLSAQDTIKILTQDTIEILAQDTAKLITQDTTKILARDTTKITKEEAENTDFIFWTGTKSKLTALEFASYCAPIFWFSSDEPVLKRTKGKDIRIPSNYPFEADSNRPVVYYQIRDILVEENARGLAWIPDKKNRNNSIIDLSKINGVQIDYTHYYEFEAGLGAHKHDNEQVQFKIYVDDNEKRNGVTYYQLILLQVTAKAHALTWYDNIYVLDTNTIETELPFNILVEEGKHASCTDVNGDGYYTPGYDVNVSTNDAWGLRDVIRTGGLFTPDFQSWMAKIRKPEYRVFPPLPLDSPYRKKFMVDSVYASDNAVYELRPMPRTNKALPDRLLKKDMTGYSMDVWPQFEKDTDIRKVVDWWEADRLLKSISIAARYNVRAGIAISFPLLIVKNVETPVIGGWMVNRIYFQDVDFRDFGYNILITPSASRFLDPYFAVGFEQDKFNDEVTGEVKRKTDFVMETGIKLRANVKFSFLKFLGFLTDFWGVRLGIKNQGFMEIKKLSYVIEIGAGVW